MARLDQAMATRSKTRKKDQDDKQVSLEKHEIQYTTNKLANETRLPKPRIRAALILAKTRLGRNTDRTAVERATKKIVSKQTSAASNE